MCDPVLCLITDLFNVHIVHEWNLGKKLKSYIRLIEN